MRSIGMSEFKKRKTIIVPTFENSLKQPRGWEALAVLDFDVETYETIIFVDDYELS